jgi:hypothetical protein
MIDGRSRPEGSGAGLRLRRTRRSGRDRRSCQPADVRRSTHVILLRRASAWRMNLSDLVLSSTAGSPPAAGPSAPSQVGSRFPHGQSSTGGWIRPGPNRSSGGDDDDIRRPGRVHLRRRTSWPHVLVQRPPPWWGTKMLPPVRYTAFSVAGSSSDRPAASSPSWSAVSQNRSAPAPAVAWSST